jgi:hypothetical protein
MKDILKEYKAESEAIKKALLPYKGMTINEAKKHGFGIKELKLQDKLWELGFKITDRI